MFLYFFGIVSWEKIAIARMLSLYFLCSCFCSCGVFAFIVHFSQLSLHIRHPCLSILCYRENVADAKVHCSLTSLICAYLTTSVDEHDSLVVQWSGRLEPHYSSTLTTGWVVVLCLMIAGMFSIWLHHCSVVTLAS